MEYRILPHGGEKIGVLGLGTSVLAEAGEVAAARTFTAAFENGINYVDLAGGHTALFPGLGRALKSAVAGGRNELYSRCTLALTTWPGPSTHSASTWTR